MPSKPKEFKKTTGLYVIVPCIKGRLPRREILIVDNNGFLYIPDTDKDGKRTYMKISDVLKFGQVIIESTTKASDAK